MTDSTPAAAAWTPLPNRLVPRSFDELVGQAHLLAEDQVLTRPPVPNLVLWGGPGVGKSALARLVVEREGGEVIDVDADRTGARAFEQVMDGARLRAAASAQRVFVRVNAVDRLSPSSQQLLARRIDGSHVRLVGETRQHPTVALVGELRGRCEVVAIEAPGHDGLRELIHRALDDAERGLGPTAPAIAENAVEALIRDAAGDVRRLLLTLELAAAGAARRAEAGTPGLVSLEVVEAARTERDVLYSRDGRAHYAQVAALLAALRGSDPDGALYWLVRLIEQGEDPVFVARRLVVFASEDVGTADPRALTVALDASRALDRLGMPEAILALSQACIYLALAPRSNAVLRAWLAARRDVLARPAARVPDSVTTEDASGRQRRPRFPHHLEPTYPTGRFLPDTLRGRIYYRPGEDGFEQVLAERIAALDRESGE